MKFFWQYNNGSIAELIEVEDFKAVISLWPDYYFAFCHSLGGMVYYARD